jgi:hypothetical protein
MQNKFDIGRIMCYTSSALWKFIQKSATREKYGYKKKEVVAFGEKKRLGCSLSHHQKKVYPRPGR